MRCRVLLFTHKHQWRYTRLPTSFPLPFIYFYLHIKHHFFLVYKFIELSPGDPKFVLLFPFFGCKFLVPTVWSTKPNFPSISLDFVFVSASESLSSLFMIDWVRSGSYCVLSPKFVNWVRFCFFSFSVAVLLLILVYGFEFYWEFMHVLFLKECHR